MTLEEARISAALTISELSRLSGISRTTIEKMERGDPVTAVSAQAVCNALSQKLGQNLTYRELGIAVSK